MNMKEVFTVEGFLPVKENTWRVRGRAYQDLKVGDTIAIDKSNQFTITAISTYGKEVQELNRMLTGNLMLRGANGERLKGARMLVRP